MNDFTKENPGGAPTPDRDNEIENSQLITTKTKSKKQPVSPPSNALFVMRWSDLPHTEEQASYRFFDGEKVKTISVSHKTRRVLEGLMQQPIKCASPCRISHFVNQLRDEFDLNIETIRYPSSTKGNKPYGVYFLRSKIERIAECEVA